MYIWWLPTIYTMAHITASQSGVLPCALNSLYALDPEVLSPCEIDLT